MRSDFQIDIKHNQFNTGSYSTTEPQGWGRALYAIYILSHQVVDVSVLFVHSLFILFWYFCMTRSYIYIYFVRPNFSCSVPLISEGQVRSQLVLHWHCKLMHNSGCTIYEDEWHTWIKLLLLHINNHFPEVIILGVWNVCWYGENVMLCFNAMSCNVPLEGLLSFSHRELRYKPVEKN